MISLDIQIKLIIFSFIYGFLFSIILDLTYKYIHNTNKFIKIISSLFIISIMVIIYFIGIKKIGELIFHPYSMISIIIGFFLYDIIIYLIEKNSKR